MTMLPTTNVPAMLADAAIPAIARRLERCYSGPECAWELFYQPRWERANFATRYHLVYPALAYFIQLKQLVRWTTRRSVGRIVIRHLGYTTGIRQRWTAPK